MQQRDKIVVDSTVISVLTRNMLGERPKKICYSCKLFKDWRMTLVIEDLKDKSSFVYCCQPGTFCLIHVCNMIEINFIE